MTYRILKDRLADVTEKFAKLAKRAKKLGVTAPTFQVVSEYTEVEVLVPSPAFHGVESDWVRADKRRPANATGRAREILEVEILGEPIVKMAGWTFVAALDHDLGGACDGSCKDNKK